MIQKIKTFLVIGLVSLGLAGPAMIPAFSGVASADLQASLCDGVKAAAANSDSCTSTGSVNAEGGLKTLAKKVVNIFSIIIGAAAVIMILYGGFRYITSGGDSGRVGNAKNTLIYAIIGLVIVALAQVIVRFVISNATDATSTF
jgi:hypothetical protein